MKSKRVLMFLVLVCSWISLLGSCSHAGYWRVEYHASGNNRYIRQAREETPTFPDHSSVFCESNGARVFYVFPDKASHQGGSAWTDNLKPEGMYWDYKSHFFTQVGTATNAKVVDAGNTLHNEVSTKGSVTAFLVWVPSADELEPPTRVYVVEALRFGVSRQARINSHIAVQDMPFKYSFSDNFKGDVENLSSTSDFQLYSNGSQLVELSNEPRSHILRLPTRMLRADAVFQSQDTVVNPDATDASCNMFVSIHYEVEPVGFSITPISEIQFVNFLDPISPQIVVAGGKQSIGHMVSVSVQAYLGGIFFRKLNILSGIRVKPEIVNAGRLALGVLTMNSDKTDSTGKINGTYRSSDTAPQRIVLHLGDLAPVRPSLTIDQVWADPTDAERWQYSSKLDFDKPNFVSFRPRFSAYTRAPDGSYLFGWHPILSHSMAFKVKKIAYQKWDEELEDYKTELTEDPALIATMASFSPATGVTDTGDGVYNTQLSVKKTDNLISQVFFDVEDEDVYATP